MEYLRQLFALVRKDLALELRTRERIAAMGAFVVLVAILFNYAIDRTAVSTQEIAAGLNRVLSDPDLREDLRERGLAHTRKFSWSRTAEQTIQVYRRALSRDTGGKSQ